MMHDWYGNAGWGMPFFGFGPLLLVIIIGLAIYFLAWRGRNLPTANRDGGAVDILDRRLAAGEIDKQQYEDLKRTIQK